MTVLLALDLGQHHAAKLVDNEHVQRRRWVIETHLEKLQNRLRSACRFFESDGHVTQSDDRVVGDEDALVVRILGHED